MKTDANQDGYEGFEVEVHDLSVDEDETGEDEIEDEAEDEIKLSTNVAIDRQTMNEVIDTLMEKNIQSEAFWAAVQWVTGVLIDVEDEIERRGV